MSNGLDNLRQHPLLHLAGVLIALACLLPIVWLLWIGLGPGADEVAAVLRRPSTLQVVWRSLWLAAVVGGFAVAVSLPLAWLVHATDLPGRAVWRTLLVLPLAIPSYVTGFVVVGLFDASGPATRVLTQLGLAGFDPWSSGGALLALSFLYPLALLPAQAALQRVGPAQWEAARSLGATPSRAFLTVVLPQLRAALAGGFIVVALYVLSDFGAVSLLRVETLSYGVYQRYRVPTGRMDAVGYALLLAALAVALVLLWQLMRGRIHAGSARDAVARPWPVVPLGRWRWPALAFCLVLTAWSLVLPVAVVVFWLVRGLRQGQALDGVVAETAATLVYSGVAALLAVALALVPALLARHGSPRLTRAVRMGAHAGYALPGIVVALALVFFATRWAGALYQTAAMLLFAYLLRFLPLAMQAVTDGVEGTSPRLVEAARCAGCSPQIAWLRVLAPAVLPALLAGFAVVFLSTIKELPATLLLRPLGVETLATRIWSLTSDAWFARAALPVLVMLVLAVGLMLLHPAIRRRDP